MAFTITADSKPLYDTFGWADYWQCADWINWHKALVAKYGVDSANKTWADAWLDGVSTAGGGRGVAPGSNAVFDSVPLDCRTFNSGFRDYIKKYKALNDAVYSGIGGTIVKPIGAAVDIVGNASNAVSNAGSTAENVTKTLKVVVPVVIVLAVAGGMWWAYNKYVKV